MASCACKIFERVCGRRRRGDPTAGSAIRSWRAPPRFIVIDKYIKRLIGFADQHTILEKGKVVWQGDSAQLSVQTELWDQYLSV